MFTIRIISLAFLFVYPCLVWLKGKNGLVGLGGLLCAAGCTVNKQINERA
jgi:hypothetical protein